MSHAQKWTDHLDMYAYTHNSAFVCDMAKRIHMWADRNMYVLFIELGWTEGAVGKGELQSRALRILVHSTRTLVHSRRILSSLELKERTLVHSRRTLELTLTDCFPRPKVKVSLRKWLCFCWALSQKSTWHLCQGYISGRNKVVVERMCS